MSRAGGKEDAINSRDRYNKANCSKTPFGTTQSDAASAWGSTSKSTFRPATA